MFCRNKDCYTIMHIHFSGIHVGQQFTTKHTLDMPGSFIFYCLQYLIYDYFNILRPRQNCHYFADIFKCIFLNGNVWIRKKMSLKFVPINNITTLVQIMAWCKPDDNPLPEQIMVDLLMHICVTQPQWVEHYLYIILYIMYSDKYNFISM